MSNPNNNLGEYLKKLRESKGFSIDDIADITKINLNILKNLENNNTSNLPNSTYVKGFIKNYCKACRSEFDYAISLWEQSQNIKSEHLAKNTTNLHSKTPDQERKKKQDPIKSVKNSEGPKALGKNIKFILNQKKYINVILLVLILSVISYKSYKFFETINQNSIKKTKTQESKTKTAKDKTAAGSLEKEPTTEVLSKEPVKEAKIALQKKNEKKVVATLSEKVESESEREDSQQSQQTNEIEKPKSSVDEDKIDLFPKVSFYPIGENSYTLSKDSPELSDPDLLPKGKKALFKDGIEQVFINAIYGDTWLTYKIDDKEIKSYNLKQGKSIFLSGKEVLLLIGNFKSVVFYYNNQFVKSNTKSNVKVFVFPKSKSSEYKIPLFPADSNGKLYTSKEYETLNND